MYISHILHTFYKKINSGFKILLVKQIHVSSV